MVRVARVTANDPKCRMCGKKLQPRFENICPDSACGHHVYWHSHSVSSMVKQGCQYKDCKCTRTATAGKDWKEDSAFPEVLNGFGRHGNGMFCTLRCAEDYAKYAVKQMDDIRVCLLVAGVKMNEKETVAGGVRNLAQAYMSTKEFADGLKKRIDKVS